MKNFSIQKYFFNAPSFESSGAGKEIAKKSKITVGDGRLDKWELQIIEKAVQTKRAGVLQDFLQKNNILLEEIVAELKSRTKRPPKNASRKYIQNLLNELNVGKTIKNTKPLKKDLEIKNPLEGNKTKWDQKKGVVSGDIYNSMVKNKDQDSDFWMSSYDCRGKDGSSCSWKFLFHSYDFEWEERSKKWHQEQEIKRKEAQRQAAMNSYYQTPKTTSYTPPSHNPNDYVKNGLHVQTDSFGNRKITGPWVDIETGGGSTVIINGEVYGWWGKY